MKLTDEELNLIRQWFNCVRDVNESFLKRPDFVLMGKILNYLKQINYLSRLEEGGLVEIIERAKVRVGEQVVIDRLKEIGF